MIRLTGMVNLRALVEENEDAVEAPDSLDKRAKIGVMLNKLQETGRLSPEQSAHVADLYKMVQEGDFDPTDFQKAMDKLITNPETGKQIKASSANKKDHPAASAAQSVAQSAKKSAPTKQSQYGSANDKKWGGTAPIRQEEINESEPHNNIPGDDEGVPEQSHDGKTTKADLLAIHKKAGELYNMIGEDEQLEGWVQEKVSLTAEYIDSLHSHINYEKNKPASVGDGEGTPADSPMGMAPVNHGYATNEEFSLSEWMKGKGYLRAGEEEIDELKQSTMTKAYASRSDPYGSEGDSEKGEKTLAHIRRKHGDAGAANAEKHATAAHFGRSAVDSKNQGNSPKITANTKHISKRITKAGKLNKTDSATLKKHYQDKKVKNPETGKEIQASTALKDKNHPAYNAAKSATN